MSWKELNKATGGGLDHKRDLPKTLVLLTIAAFLMFGVFLIKGGYEKQHAPPALTEEEYIEELLRLEDQIIKHKRELIELYELKRLEAEGKLHSS